MSSPDDRPDRRVEPTRRTILVGLACVAALPLAGCLTPLYGPTAQGAGLEDALRTVQVEPVVVPRDGEVLGHHLRQELVFALDGSGRATTDGPKTYGLSTQVSIGTRSPIVNSRTLRASVSTLNGTARYTLTNLEGGGVVTRGSVRAAVSYENTVQRFAAVRAAREAQIRLAKLLADEMRTQVAIALRAPPSTAFSSGR